MIKFSPPKAGPPLAENPKSGLTLVEALVATTVLLVGVIAVIQLFPTGLSAIRLSRNETMATNLVQGKIEDLKALPYANVNIETRAPVSANPASPYYHFERATQVSLIDGNLNPSILDVGLKKVIVTVYWSEKGQDQTISATYIKHQ